MALIKGFSLIELLVTIAIIGLLSTLAVVSFNGARSKARDASRLSSLRQIKLAFSLYYNDVGTWPTGNACLGYDEGQSCWIGPTGKASINNSMRPYIGELPIDPSYASRTVGNAYVYFYGKPTWHCSGSIFPYPTGPYIAWQPDKPLASGDAADSRCLEAGFMSCCDFGCPNGYYCVYSLQ